MNDPSGRLRAELTCTIASAEHALIAPDGCHETLAATAWHLVSELALSRQVAALALEVCAYDPEEDARAFVRLIGADRPYASDLLLAAAGIDPTRAGGVRTLLELALDGWADLTEVELKLWTAIVIEATSLLEQTSHPPHACPLHADLLGHLQRLAHADDGNRGDEMALLASLAASLCVEAHRPGFSERLQTARQISAEVVDELQDVGTRPFACGMLLTTTHLTFTVLLAAEQAASLVHGMCFPGFGLVALSPGHATQMLDPDPDHPLFPVHVHEMAHASARNAEAVFADPTERDLSEGYAEVVSALALPGLARRTGRSFRPSTEYPRQVRTIKLIADVHPHGMPGLISDLSSASSMLQVVADVLCDGDLVTARDLVQDMLDAGQPYAGPE